MVRTLADRRSLLALVLLVTIAVAVVASMAVLGAAPAPTLPSGSAGPAPSAPLFVTGPPNDSPAVSFRDFEYKTATVASVSASSAQSKLWYAQGAWWGGLYSPAANEFHIFRLDWATQTWRDTGTVVDERPDADADYLWTGTNLYVASATKGSTSSHRARIVRFHFDVATDRFVQDPDFPVAINDTGASGIVIDRDGTGRLWVTYVSGGTLWVAHTLSSDAHWAVPYRLPGGGPLRDEDVSSIVPFGPGRVGVMWTDQAATRVLFASHADGEGDDAWSPVEIVATGVGESDDQLNLKTFELDGARVIASPIRMTADTDAARNQLGPQIVVMIREADGHWRTSEVGRVEDKHNRPILLIDEERRLMYVVAQSPAGGGIVSSKRASLDTPVFPTGTGDPFIVSSDDPAVANATSTKQSVSAASGMVVLASDESTGRYLHGTSDLGDTPIPTDVAAAPRLDQPAPPVGTVARPLVDDEFASWPIGEPVTGWTVDAVNGTAVVGGKDALRYLSLGSSAAAGSVETCKDFAQVGATRLLVDVRFRPSVGGSGEIRPLEIRGPGGDIVGIKVRQDGEFSFFDGALRQRPGILLVDGRWYRARLDIDVAKRLTNLVLTDAAGKTIVKGSGLRWRNNEPGQPSRICFKVSGKPAFLDIDRLTVSR